MDSSFYDIIKNNIKAEIISVKDDEICFKHENHNYLLLYDGNYDEYYFRLIMPNIIGSKHSDNYYPYINKVNYETKVIKLYIVDDYIWAEYSTFFFDKKELKYFLKRALSLFNIFYSEILYEIQK